MERKFTDIFTTQFYTRSYWVNNVVEQTTNVNKEIPGRPGTSLPAGRTSIISPILEQDYRTLRKQLRFVTPEFELEAIPLIRQLYKCNPDLGLVLFDLIQLTNTGHTIQFDEKMDAKQKAKMIKHLEERRKSWGMGLAGINGLVNKMVAQIYVGGALSTEWVPQTDLKGINFVAFVNPEEIRFGIKNNKGRYVPYQSISHSLLRDNKNLIKLNENTYKYFGLYGDTDSPHGVPPFLTALEAITTQTDMKKNINFIMKQMGLMGFLEALLDKPDQMANESESAYLARINRLLTEAKNNISEGMTDGVMVGYKEDHEFQFHSTTKNMQGVGDIFNQNEVQVASGLKTSPGFMGLKGIGTESSTGIVFTKMLSQLGNVQDILAANLEFGYGLELQMAGFRYEGLKVKFKASTITDDLKMQQADEIKIRNKRTLYSDGVISLETYSEEMGYGEPDQKEPRAPIFPQGAGDAEKDQKKEKDKDTSDRKVRDKNKPQPKRKDNNTKPV